MGRVAVEFRRLKLDAPGAMRAMPFGCFSHRLALWRVAVPERCALAIVCSGVVDFVGRYFVGYTSVSSSQESSTLRDRITKNTQSIMPIRSIFCVRTDS